MTASQRAANLRRKLFALLGEFKDFHQAVHAVRGRSEAVADAKGMADTAACRVADAYEAVNALDLFIDAHRDDPEYPFPLTAKQGEELAEDFPTTLARLRTAAGLSVPDLARKSGLSDDVLRQYESGARRPTWDSVQKIATALGVPTDAFRESK